jgi:hypothetical protein
LKECGPISSARIMAGRRRMLSAGSEMERRQTGATDPLK